MSLMGKPSESARPGLDAGGATVDKPGADKSSADKSGADKSSGDKSGADKSSADKSSDPAAATLFNKDSTDEQKLKAVQELANAGVKDLSYRDGSGNEHKLRMAVESAGNRQMVHMYASGADGAEQIALRGIARADGSFEHERDSKGNFVDFKGKGHAQLSEQPEALSSAKRNQPQSDAAAGAAHQQSPNPSRSARPEAPREAAPVSRGADAPEARPGSVDRSQFDAQLKDPRVMAAFAGRMSSEVGSQGPAAQLAFAEEVMNRAASRNQTLMQALSGRYYPTHNPGHSNNPKYVEAITKAWKEGTDTTQGATGNASGKVGFGVKGGHYDANHHWVSPNQTVRIGGERFGYEQVDVNKGWLKKYAQLKRGSEPTVAQLD